MLNSNVYTHTFVSQNLCPLYPESHCDIICRAACQFKILDPEPEPLNWRTLILGLKVHIPSGLKDQKSQGIKK